MKVELVFGRIFGVGRRLCAGVFLQCKAWQFKKVLWLGMFGMSLGKKEVGSFFVIDLLMTGS